MRHAILITRKELAGYFSSPIAYVFLIAFLLLSVANMIYLQAFFEVGQASMRLFFESLPWIYLILVPAITMRSWSEERREGTIELLMTLPLRPGEVLAGKFLSGWVFLGIALALTLPVPMIVSTLGDLDWGLVIGSYVGSFLLGGAYLAIGICVSAMSRNQILSFILAAFFCLAFLAVGKEEFMSVLPRQLAEVAQLVGFLPHFANIQRGVIDTRNLAYFASVIFFFLVVNRYLILSYRYA